MTLPVALSGSDVIGQAKTGTGKTLGFGLPLLERVVVPADVEAGRAKPEQLTDAPQALVVVPTRELCQQVTNDLLTAGKVRNVRVLAIYGGRAYEPQVEALKKGVDVIVGTPGRLLDLAGQKKLDLSHIKALVLDEADEMLDLGFLPDVERIMMMLPAKRQTMLFSATMPGAVINLARRYMSQPTHIRATAPDDEGQTVANIKQHVFRAHNMDKPEMVSRILQAEERALAMVFCRTKRTAADIADQLARRGFASGAVHGDLGQGAREQALRAFRNGKVDVLVCTDVAARGIDVDNVTHVINYQSPEDEKTYLHRIGRTGRAGKSGTAVTLVDWDDIPRWKLINKALDLPFDEPEETYSTSPHLYELLNIPAGTKGILPRSERTRAGLAAEEIEDLGETGGRGARGRGPKQAPVAEEERPARTRTPRQRRRTRGGATAGAEAPVTTVATPVAEPVAEPAARPVAEGAPETPSKPRRRRRTRHSASSAAPAAAAVTATPEAAPAAAPAPVAAAEPEQPRRRRARVAKPLTTDTAEAGFQTVETAAAALAAATATIPSQATESTPVQPEEKPKRTRKAAAPKADAAEAPVKRTRKVAAPKVEADAEVTEEKPKRTRKAAAPKAEAETPEAEAKPKRTRKVAAPKADAETPEAETKPKRTRKTAAPKAEAETAEAEAKPKRTRKAAAPKAEAETPEAEAKPKRTRKVAAPKADAETPEAEAKPKRTRKAAAPKTEAEAEAKPKRTRKAAAPKAEATS
ncbi:DEAD/DEAH box helicase [Streptomyces olivoreticuli]|uniref:DEAD/DEAH box helicase n=1 Tax=Streptomyces olivoreticuli TaxID=68246 RepID=UPI0026585213|nr:DEAD/DEAH box helicase [Streptomyces olivoreticuli]WKK26046.1 DEAD/DEAH box helicase [Streptomyces olivoreticuli]